MFSFGCVNLACLPLLLLFLPDRGLLNGFQTKQRTRFLPCGATNDRAYLTVQHWQGSWVTYLYFYTWNHEIAALELKSCTKSARAGSRTQPAQAVPGCPGRGVPNHSWESPCPSTPALGCLGAKPPGDDGEEEEPGRSSPAYSTSHLTKPGMFPGVLRDSISPEEREGNS